MRLSPKEIQALTSSFNNCLFEIEFKLYLFGSRVDDTKKGGDIDLLVVVKPENKSSVVNLKSKIRKSIFTLIPEQKIDITVASDDELKSDVFLSEVIKKAILL